jgi:hypothetical protein
MGGYLGADAVLCVAAVASAGTGQYDLLVTADLRIADATVRARPWRLSGLVFLSVFR